MTDHATRMALWSSQGMRRCAYCGCKVYTHTHPGGDESLEHVDYTIGGTPRIAAHRPSVRGRG